MAYRTHPDLVYRVLGYAGLALLALLRLQSDPGPASALLLLFSLLWPTAWWWTVCRWPELRSPRHRWSPLAHVLESLLVLSLVAAVRVDEWFLLSVSLLCLTGVTALGGIRLLAPCLVSVGAFLLASRWRSGLDALPESITLIGWLLLLSCLLGLAWQSYGQALRLRAHRLSALSESARLQRRNERLARYLPEALAPMISESPDALRPPRERFVTVAFVDVVGFAQLVVVHGVAEVADVLNDFMAMVGRLTEHHGGVVGKFLGDGVLVYFCEPEMESGQGAAPAIEGRTDAAAGATRLALALAPALDDLGRSWRERGLSIRLQARVGIASGYCALGDWGGQARLDYTLIGTPVNLASRLQAAAEPGGVLLSGTTAALIARNEALASRLGGPRPIEVKGFGVTMVHELSASAKVRAIPTLVPIPARFDNPDT